ncbi:hypothetical protein FraQA3DRAFT_5932 [Frankia sp. QA3]|nr:hypothetical protein FraQA3DRAFT_5932 [Frankia sp. QA3]
MVEATRAPSDQAGERADVGDQTVGGITAFG